MKSAGKWHLIFLMNDWTSPSDLPNVPNQCYKVYLQIWHIRHRQVETIIFSWSSRSQHLLSILSCLFPTILINESGKKGSIKLVNFALWKLEEEIPPLWTDMRYTDRGLSPWSCKCHHMLIIVFQADSATWNYSDIWQRLRSPCCLLPGLSACYARCNQL